VNFYNEIEGNEETACLFLYIPHYSVAVVRVTSGIPFSNTFLCTAKLANYSINVSKEKCDVEEK
jgi:hypothetical protein